MKNLWGYGRKVHAKCWPWGMPWDSIYDPFSVSCLRIRGVTGPGRYLIFFLVKFHVECRQNHVWGPLGARFMTNLVKHVFFAKVGKDGESDPLSSDPLGSDPLSSDPLSSHPLSSDPLSSDPLVAVHKYKNDVKAVQEQYKSGTKTVQERCKNVT